ncbi:unnamed protein product [Closterium sp. Naga37s-1]|nr:unnamed protein product [Closterium sp. Naga37s-1]
MRLANMRLANTHTRPSPPIPPRSCPYPTIPAHPSPLLPIPDHPRPSLPAPAHPRPSPPIPPRSCPSPSIPAHPSPLLPIPDHPRPSLPAPAHPRPFPPIPPRSCPPPTIPAHPSPSPSIPAHPFPLLPIPDHPRASLPSPPIPAHSRPSPPIPPRSCLSPTILAHPYHLRPSPPIPAHPRPSPPIPAHSRPPPSRPSPPIRMEMPLEFREVIFEAEKTISVAHLDGCSECGGMEMPLEFREVIFGAEKTINVAHLDGCSECGGSGAKAGTSPRTCPTCRGMGQVMQTRQTAFGMFSSVSTCSTCAGVGEVISEFCRKCGGEGRVRTRKPVVINVPAGVDSGTVLRVKGEGDAGMRGGKRGDLYVFVKVKETMGIRRDGINLYSNVSIDFTDAILGTVAKVATVDGAAELRVPAGTQPGDTLVLERKGVPKVGKSNIRGDHFFQVNVSIPKRVSPTERDLVEELASIHKTGKTRTGITVEGARPRGSSSSSGVDGEGIVDTVK